ncbi:MAG: c-type cytochrome [Candidatus Omnitrophica bacterium]|nr:c-type cytochrome [Candidatus Omnitrophota bacterium]
MQRCFVCHTIGSGDKIGPDLNNVAKNEKEEWLKAFIQHPSAMFSQNDPTATKLLGRYRTPMPDLGLTDQDVADVISYIKSASIAESSPETEIKIIKKKSSPENISKGMALFVGERRFLHKGPSCISCHDIRKISVFAGGNLGKDLTTSYSRLGDAGVGAILKDPPFPIMREAYVHKELTNEEIARLTDFLGNVDEKQAPENYQADLMTGGIIWLLVLFLFFYFIVWAVGK